MTNASVFSEKKPPFAGKFKTSHMITFLKIFLGIKLLEVYFAI